MLKTSDKEKILKAARKKTPKPKQVTTQRNQEKDGKGTKKIGSSAREKTVKHFKSTFQKKPYEHRILYPVKISFKSEGEIKTS